jgi:tRNA A-37 threonylcarbamoyl transferase component Bud32
MSTLQTLGKYEIRRQLGRGAMGIVYEGWDPVIKRQVAIKTVRLPDTVDDETADELARFRREAEAAGRLNHPNVVGVFDYGEAAGVAYIVMEYVDGPTLKLLLDQNEKFAPPRIVQIMEDLLAGLQFSHERGVVHRDIKPANLMLTHSGQAKITDFGIARIESSSMTQAGTVLGTPAYMSPEQFLGQVVDARSDIYSSGVLLYQLLTGERPFAGGTSSIMHKALNTEAPSPSQISVTAPRRFDAVVQRAMAKRPEDRFASAKAFADAIRAAFAAPAPPPEVEPPDRDDADEATIVAASRAKLPDRAAAAEPITAPRPAAAAMASSRMSLPAGFGATAGATTSFPRPALLGAGVAGLAVLGGIAYFLLARGSIPTSPPHDMATQPVMSQPAATNPPPVATLPPVTDPGQAVALSKPSIPPATSHPGTDAPAAGDLPHSTPSTPVPTTNLTPPPAAPKAVEAVPPAPSPLEQVRMTAHLLPCSALSVASDPTGLRISGFAGASPELDRLLGQAHTLGRSLDNITRVEQFACTPIAAVAGLARQSWESSPRTFNVRPDRQEPVSGTRFRIATDTTLPMLYVDYYQSDGLVRHLMRPVSGVQNNPHNASVIAPAPGPGLIIAIGSAKPFATGARPEIESTADYLAVLQPQLGNPATQQAADIAMVMVRPPEPELAKVPRVDPPIAKPRPVDPATAKVPLSHAPALRSNRCSNIVSRAQLGETLSDAELTALRTECRS